MSFVAAEQREASIVIRLNNPAQRNALARFVLEELDATISASTALADIKTLIFTGTNDVFASGANIRELPQLDETTAREFALRGQNLFRQVNQAKQRTIAAVNGYCMGGGLDLALSCDIRIAAPAAVFAHPGANLGIITGWGGTQRLTRLIGATRALEMFYTARQINADEALRIGLIHEINPNVLDRACEIARS